MSDLSTRATAFPRLCSGQAGRGLAHLVPTSSRRASARGSTALGARQDSAPSLGLRLRDPGRAIPSEREGRTSGEVPRALPAGLHRTALRILIGSGPTRERIDPVRFVSNFSTGAMGAALAAEGLARGHRVTVVSGPSDEPLPEGVRVIPVVEAFQMERALRQRARGADVVMMAAAVSDFRPIRVAPVKLRRKARLTLRLRATPDIIGRLPRRKRQLVVGFALESNRVVSRAKEKLREKRLDLLLAQQLLGRRPPFGHSKVRAWLLVGGGRAGHGRVRSGMVTRLGTVSKAEVARAVLDKIETLWYGQQAPRTEAHAARA